MDYNSDHYYRIAYVIMLIVLIPFYFINHEMNHSFSIILSNFVFTAIIVGTEYSYIFPRQAMKLYEEILLKSLVEKKYLVIQFIIFISFSVIQAFFFTTSAFWPLLIYSVIYYGILYFVKSQLLSVTKILL